MKHYIITGTSTGLGKAIAQQLMQKGNILYCLSRSKNTELIEEAQKVGVSLYYYEIDLGNVEEVTEHIMQVFEQIQTEEVSEITLINNAGVINPIKPIERCEDDAIIHNVHVNLVAPIILTKAFIHATSEIKGKKTIVNISSGAGKNPVPSWSIYCASKAGIDLFTKTIAKEQESVEFPVKMISFAPGVVDTNMQINIRSASAEDFSMVEKFVGYKETGQLRSAETVAKVIEQLLLDEEVENGEVLDISLYKNNKLF
ncbi:hypothetical protein BTR23_15105 [Alkalihalophilus pseudofirmus]|uniref:(S)-benzoin forming benzil reductase n=1 Tax=Alkalihalobacterium alkalinitrilicum TaxID=427920 RepID=UPI00094C1541|nr:(S)-benzoin forming benzil reductase [Alkalihalobacterium alkalinitrilicum]OLO36399.1 hypothetical protein BTR23_15105 [Alkalihalophilus pseudofirmus]